MNADAEKLNTNIEMRIRFHEKPSDGDALIKRVTNGLMNFHGMQNVKIEERSGSWLLVITGVATVAADIACSWFGKKVLDKCAGRAVDSALDHAGRIVDQMIEKKLPQNSDKNDALPPDVGQENFEITPAALLRFVDNINAASHNSDVRICPDEVMITFSITEKYSVKEINSFGEERFVEQATTNSISIHKNYKK